jgi:hypothetical protein
MKLIELFDNVQASFAEASEAERCKEEGGKFIFHVLLTSDF